MIDLILNNLKIISYIIILIFTFQLSNMIFGIQLNCVKLGNKFDIKKILKWLAKTICTLMGTALLSIGLTMFPIIVSKSGVTISTDMLSGINFVIITGIGVSVAIIEAKKAIINFYLAFIDITNTDSKNVEDKIIIKDTSKIDENLKEIVDDTNKTNKINENIDLQLIDK